MTIDSLLSLDISHFRTDWGVSEAELSQNAERIRAAGKAVTDIRRTGKGPDGSLVLFPHLPYLLEEDVLIDREEREALEDLELVAKDQDAIISIGIGGSYLGNQVLFDLFCGPYWNLIPRKERNGYPQLYFAGQNLDPVSLLRLADQIKRNATAVWWKPKILLLVISKSGTTIEPWTAMEALKALLSPFCDVRIMAITGKDKNNLRKAVDQYNLPCFTVPDGIGGRFSVLSQVGLVFAKLVGIDIHGLLAGARAVEEACQSEDFEKNPALQLAALKYLARKDHGITAEVIMPYGDSLRSLGWWYAQLLGESLGKKYDNHGNVVHYGRVPVASVGTTDMHSLTQEHQQGMNNKLVQFMALEKLPHDLTVPCMEHGVTGTVPMSHLLTAARKSNEQALANDHRMSTTLTMKELTPACLGAAFYFFFLAIAYEGALADVNAYDQPGVEEYKKILHDGIRKYLEQQNGNNA